MNTFYYNDKEYVELAQNFQNTEKYDNFGVRLLLDEETGKYFYYENHINDHLFEEIDYSDLVDYQDENGNIDYQEYLVDKIRDWIFREEDDVVLASLQWELESPKNCDLKSEGPFRILVVGWYSGYYPINWEKDERYEDRIFDTYKEAENWIEEQENTVYYLKHNEAGRPDYYIYEV